MKTIKTFEAYKNAKDFFHGSDQDSQIDIKNASKFPKMIQGEQCEYHISLAEYDDIYFSVSKFNYEKEFQKFLSENPDYILVVVESRPNITGDDVYIAYSPTTKKSAYVFDGCTYIVKTKFKTLEECVTKIGTGRNGRDYETD